MACGDAELGGKQVLDSPKCSNIREIHIGTQLGSGGEEAGLGKKFVNQRVPPSCPMDYLHYIQSNTHNRTILLSHLPDCEEIGYESNIACNQEKWLAGYVHGVCFTLNWG